VLRVLIAERYRAVRLIGEAEGGKGVSWEAGGGGGRKT
jgi:hypothetical protein